MDITLQVPARQHSYEGKEQRFWNKAVLNSDPGCVHVTLGKQMA